MQYRAFGHTDLLPSAIGMGCSRIASLARWRDHRSMVDLLHEAFDLGINFFDTADSYGLGGSERLISRAFRDRRDRVLISTKAGHMFGPSLWLARKAAHVLGRAVSRMPGPLGANFALRLGGHRKNFSPPYIRCAIEASLRRLRTDYIDLFMLHSPPREVIEDAEVFETLEDARSAGLIRYYGVSCSSDIREAFACLDHEGIAALQVTINLAQQEAIDTLLPTAVERGIAIIARQPFAGGVLLSGAEQRLTAMAHTSRTPAQLALQCMLQIEGISVVLPGISKLSHLRENVQTLSLPPLSAEEFEVLRTAVASPC